MEGLPVKMSTGKSNYTLSPFGYGASGIMNIRINKKGPHCMTLGGWYTVGLNMRLIKIIICHIVTPIAIKNVVLS